MIPLQAVKAAVAIAPAAILDDTSATATAVDTKGWRRATFVFQLGATDIALTALKIQESDDDSSYSDVTGTVMGTDADAFGTTSVLPSATDDNKVIMMDIGLRGNRKRYLKAVATFGNGTAGGFISGTCLLSNGENAPTSNSEAGCDTVMRV